jgi:hypothetical protein
MTTMFGSTMLCRRAARFGVTPLPSASPLPGVLLPIEAQGFANGAANRMKSTKSSDEAYSQGVHDT